MGRVESLLGEMAGSPIFSLVVAIVLSGVAIGGKFSVIATQFLFAIAFLLAALGLWSVPGPIWIGLCTAIAGCLILLAYWARPEAIPIFSGKLQANKTLFSRSISNQKRRFEIGNSGAIFVITAPEGIPILTMFEQSNLMVEMIKGRLAISTDIRDRDGHIVAELSRNEWKVAPPPKTWDRNYSKDALEVRDASGRIVLQVHLLPDRIRIQGEWRAPGGQGIRLVKTPGPPGASGATIIKITEMYDPLHPAIIPMFVYPSDTHLGELAR